MGNIFDMFSSWVQGNREACILILGLDASGKTTIMNRLKYGDNRQTIPTIGFDVEHINGDFAPTRLSVKKRVFFMMKLQNAKIQ